MLNSNKLLAEPDAIKPEIEFYLPYRKNKDGLYKILPNKRHVGGKNSLRKAASKKVNIGYLYLIRIAKTNYYKIGVSQNPKRRIKNIASYLPFELEILAINQINNPYNFEQELIDDFRHKLIKSEWFNLTIGEAKHIMIVLHNQQVKESIYG